ncbi:MAG: HAD family phosphatase [Clostridia bacterium]|nr:HAD family phosphatase [Clostridia bacterium]
MEIKNVILDMGNVLLSYDPDYSVNLLCENESAKAVIKKEFFGGYEWIQTDLGAITPEERLNEVKKRVPEAFHKDLEAVSDGWDVCMKPLDGAKKFFSYLKENGYRVYLLSNASTEFYRYFPREFDIAQFDGTVVSCDLHIIKPDPEIYLYLLKKYSLRAQECLFVDDMEKNTDGAKAVGMNAFQFKGSYEDIKKII